MTYKRSFYWGSVASEAPRIWAHKVAGVNQFWDGKSPRLASKSLLYRDLHRVIDTIVNFSKESFWTALITKTK